MSVGDFKDLLASANSDAVVANGDRTAGSNAGEAIGVFFIGLYFRV